MNYREQQIQMGMVKFFNLQYPKLRGLLCSNLNNSKDKKTGGINQGMGVIAGRSDLVLYLQGKAYHIEVKQPSGSQSKNQKSWQVLIESQGFNYFIVHSLEEFVEVLVQIGFKRPNGF